jgi:hypothetical protein
MAETSERGDGGRHLSSDCALEEHPQASLNKVNAKVNAKVNVKVNAKVNAIVLLYQ